MVRPFGHPGAKHVFATLHKRNHHFGMHHVSSRHRKRALHTTSKFALFDTPDAKSLLFTFSRVQHKVLATMRLELEVGRHCWIFGFQDCQKLWFRERSRDKTSKTHLHTSLRHVHGLFARLVHKSSFLCVCLNVSPRRNANFGKIKFETQAYLNPSTTVIYKGRGTPTPGLRLLASEDWNSTVGFHILASSYWNSITGLLVLEFDYWPPNTGIRLLSSYD